MGQEREVTNAPTLTTEDKEKSNAAAMELLRDKEAFTQQQSEILARSIVQDNLNVHLPSGVYGEWIPNNGNSINEAKMKGFSFHEASKEEQNTHGMHGDATSHLIISDTVFMTMPQWKKDVHVQLQNERIRKLHSNKTNQAEEDSFLADGRSTGTKEITTFSESHSSNVALSKT